MPVDPASLIQVGGQLLGGLFGGGDQSPMHPDESRFKDIKGIMDAAKAFGINPLTILGTTTNPGAPPARDFGAMSNGIANAAMIAGDAIAARRLEKAKMEKLNQRAASLQKRLDAVTIRPPVPGIYGQPRLPSDPQVYGDAPANTGYTSGQSSTGGPARAGTGDRLLSEVDPADPRRGVDNKPVPNSAGVMVVDSPYFPKMWFPTIDGDEPLDLLDLPSMAIGVPQLGYGFGDRLTYGGGLESRPAMSRAEARDYGERAALSAKRPKAKPKAFIKYSRPSYGAAWVQ